MNNTNLETDKFFSSDWDIYRKVLQNNSMFHQEIYATVRSLMRKRYGNKPFKLLDLGCGDASYLANSLQDTAISHYTGFDLSNLALEIAAKNIATLGCVASLVNTDFMRGLAETNERFDVIFTSYALHHLTYEEKAQFFAQVKSALTETGFLLMIDVVREPTENLQVYLDNYCQWLTENWLCFNATELAAIYQHIRLYDLPETLDTLNLLATAAGFKKSTCIHSELWHQCISWD